MRSDAALQNLFLFMDSWWFLRELSAWCEMLYVPLIKCLNPCLQSETLCHHNTTPLSVVIFSSVWCLVHWCKILTCDWLLSPLQVWSHRCVECNLRGRVEREATAERRGGRGGEGRDMAAAKCRFISAFLSFSFCGIVFFTFFKIFFTPPLLLLYSVSCPCLHTKHLHVNMRVCTTRGSDFLSCPICHPH